MRWLNLAGIVPCTEVEGPGRRFALWVQGCRLQCPGCCNPEMFAFEPRQLATVESVVRRIASSQEHFRIEGVTFLGGEPVLQAQSLAEVAAACQARGLSVMVFTGYTIEQLHREPLPGVAELLAATDVLVDGPYFAGEADHVRNWAGSSNQRFHFLTECYAAGIERDPRWADGVEFAIDAMGKLTRSGWPDLPQQG